MATAYRLLEFSSSHGPAVVVEVAEPDTGEPSPAGRMHDATARAALTFEQALDRIQPVLNAIVEKSRGIAAAPDTVQIEVGFKFNSNAGVILAAVGTEGTFKVTLEWKRQAAKP